MLAFSLNKNIDIIYNKITELKYEEGPIFASLPYTIPDSSEQWIQKKSQHEIYLPNIYLLLMKHACLQSALSPEKCR